MIVYIVTVQGQYIDVFQTEAEAVELKHDLYMRGSDGIHIEQKVLL